MHYFVSLLTITAFYSMQFYYDLELCDRTLLKTILLTTLILVPAWIYFFRAASVKVVVYCFVLLPFIIWANYHECIVPHKDAPMTYVLVFIVGVPVASFIATDLERIINKYFKR